MADSTTADPLSVKVANQIITMANDQREEGMTVDDIAAGIRHAAANFSAFAHFQTEKSDSKPDDIVEEFVNMFSHYLDMHKPKEKPASGLEQLIAQAKNEI